MRIYHPRVWTFTTLDFMLKQEEETIPIFLGEDFLWI